MSKTLEITKIKKLDILQEDFENLSQYNKFDFNKKNIAVIYGPNGTGKTTLSKIFNHEEDTEYTVEYIGNTYSNNENKLFHVIADQNNRNIIAGETKDFILGENIAKETKLKKNIDSEYEKLFGNLKEVLKSKYKITKQSAYLTEKIQNLKLKNIIKIMANKTKKVQDVDMDIFIDTFNKLGVNDLPEFDDNLFEYFIMNSIDKKDPICRTIELDISKIKKVEKISVIDESSSAIQILEKYRYVSDCIVCDTTNINHEKLIEKKSQLREDIKKTLDTVSEEILTEIVDKIENGDPFEMKAIVFDALANGSLDRFEELQVILRNYLNIVLDNINNDFYYFFKNSSLERYYSEYKALVAQKLELSKSDEQLIKNIISENLDKDVILKRDDNKNIIIYLNNTKLLETDRKDLQLSSGEQNFISIAFELLKAKNSNKPIIVLDDPISSFDSIYKNKIAFCIIKILNNKKQLILTHNTDLVRLLDVQYQNCFDLYLFNNKKDETNGFIPVSKDEQNILLYMDKLLNLLRGDIDNEILDEKLYIISLIPFMRGLAKIINGANRKKYNDELTKLMHGYESDKVNLTEIYNGLFEKQIHSEYIINAQNIVELDLSNVEILKSGKYDLLNKTLKHTLMYLYLRLSVEKKLREKYPTETRKCELLGEFIDKALKAEDKQEARIKLNSKKTLLNEFNHFEGNMNIFQPAIDIADTTLEKERIEILDILNTL
ncbi:AAA family ATPase [Clostridium sp. PL3]|uniref:AAA family ATPase n=1 Tax=Clostridium thailandense TaxID=2794346 RepID=A0A949TFY9_9CLOT|nr:AAA family ATPase [Clostridium thailandense]MBV7271485.1 AAA family ATPase [Clostridium thailandense]